MSKIKDLNEREKDALESIRMTRVILPVLIGLGVVGYLLWQQYDPDQFDKIRWTRFTIFWLLLATSFMIIRHLAYATRLYLLSKREFSFLKCIELIFIWEFSSAVSPTAVGGSAVAFFILSQEKLGMAKTATIVLYTIVLDSAFFVFTLPVLFLFFGSNMIRPDLINFSDMDGWGATFLAAYFFMAIYGSLFFYGLFINPHQMRRIMVAFTFIPWLKKFRHRAMELGNDIISASKELKLRPVPHHVKAFLATAVAWSCRFILLNCIIIALVENIDTGFVEQAKLFARLESMFVIMAFSPTPGGAGFAEIVFGGFLSDYTPIGISLIVAFVWRLLSYYSYLLAGVIIIPNWINKILIRRSESAEAA